MNQTDAGRGRTALQAFSRAINREASALSQRPDLLWQQLYNRLQWAEEPVPSLLAPELESRTAPDAAPWLRLKTPLHESEALIRTLTSEGGSGRLYGISADGTFIVSASGPIVKVWDVRTGTERVLWGNSNEVMEEINACKISPDGTFIVSASIDQIVRIWDARSGLKRASLKGSAREVETMFRNPDGTYTPSDDFVKCAIGPDGTFVVSAAQGNLLKIWDVETYKERATLAGHTDWIDALAISPDSTFIVSGSRDHTLKVWDVQTGQERATLYGHAGSVWRCAISPDSSFIVSASEDRTWKIWDSASGAQRASISCRRAPVPFVLSPDGSFVVAPSDSDVLTIWDTRSGQERLLLRGHTVPMNDALAISPDGRLIVSGAGKTVTIWDAETGARRATLTGHANVVVGCAISPDGTWIVSSSADGTLKLWDATVRSDSTPTTVQREEVSTCKISPDGSFVVFGAGKRLTLWDPWTAQERATLSEATGWIQDCAVSPDGRWMVSGQGDGSLAIWDIESGAERATLRGHDTAVQVCDISPDGSFIVSASADTLGMVWDESTGEGRTVSNRGSLKVWDARTGQERGTLVGHDMYVATCAISPNSSFIVSGSLDGTLKIWDARTGRERATLTGHTDWVRTCAVSPDGSFVVSGSRDGSCRIWDVVTGAEQATLSQGGSEVQDCAISPDRTLVVWTSYAGVRIWDMRSARLCMELYGDTGYDKIPCAISPDGNLVIAGSLDRALKIWNVRTGAELARLPLRGRLTCLAVAMKEPLVACGDDGGNIYLIDLVGIQYGPIIVTVVDWGGRPTLRCPCCRRAVPLTDDQLALEAVCPESDCGLHLRVNPFAITMSTREVGELNRSHGWRLWRRG